MTNADLVALKDAIRIWSGWGIYSWPKRNDARLRLQLGDAAADKQLAIIKNLEKDFYVTDAHLRTSDLAEMGKLAKEQFNRLHPDVPGEIADFLEWCYTYDLK